MIFRANRRKPAHSAGRSGGRLIRRREAAAIAGTTVLLTAAGLVLHDAGRPAPPWPAPARAAAARAAGGAWAVAGALGTGEEPAKDWKGTGPAATAVDPPEFAPGACLEFTPGRNGAHRAGTVFIDAGHGGIDPGGTGHAQGGAPVTESAVNLAVAMDAMKLLTGDGYRVVVSRTGPTTVQRLRPGDTDGRLLSVEGAQDDIAARDECANRARAGLLLGIYMNAGSPGEAGSVTAYDAVRPFSARSLRLANLLQSDVLAKLNGAGYGVPDGGVLDDSGMGSTLSSAGAAYGHLMLLGPAYRPGVR